VSASSVNPDMHRMPGTTRLPSPSGNPGTHGFTGRRIVLPPAILLATLIISSPSPAQEGPAVVSLPATALGPGRILLSYGADLSVKSAAAGEELGRLWRVLPISLRIGISRNVDVIGSWRGGLVARSADGGKHCDWGDPSFFTKITLTDTGGPTAAALAFGFKVP